MNKKIILGIVAITMMFTITACDFKSNYISNEEDNTQNTSNINGKCHALDCINKIKVENTTEEINSIMGFDGVLQDEKYNIYYWEISEDEGIKVAYYGGKTSTITATFERNSIADKKVDFSRYNELQPKVKSGITYNEFISYIGNVQGTVVEKSSSTVTYMWVDVNDNYLKGSFSNSSGKCTFVTGMIK